MQTKLLREINLRIEEKGFQISLGKTLLKELLDQTNEGSFGGRAVRRAFQSTVVDALADFILSKEDTATSKDLSTSR